MKARHWIASTPLILLINQLIILGVAEALYIPAIHGSIGPSLLQPHSTAAVMIGSAITFALCVLAFACFWAQSGSTSSTASPSQPESVTA